MRHTALTGIASFLVLFSVLALAGPDEQEPLKMWTYTYFVIIKSESQDAKIISPKETGGPYFTDLLSCIHGIKAAEGYWNGDGTSIVNAHDIKCIVVEVPEISLEYSGGD
jgi:hypothetical protein